MFKRLRNRFLILNAVIISIMMHVTFATLYFITYQNMRADADRELHNISEHYRTSGAHLATAPVDDMRPVPPDPVLPEHFASFFVTTDNHWNISSISSIVNLERNFYETITKEAAVQNKNRGQLELGGSDWAFLVQPAPAGYMIVFLNTTSRQGMNLNVMHSFSVVALPMFIMIFFISKFFADTSIRPIQAAFDKQKRFIADASHELKTPLAAINANVAAILSGGTDAAHSRSKWLRYIKSETERMTKLTDDLLYLAQVDYSDLQLSYAEFNLSEAVENAILTMEAIFFENRISLAYQLEPGLATRGNHEQIQQAVMILLNNALKYTNENGSVHVALQRRHRDIVLTVSNTGDGISPEHMDRIFDRFYRTDPSRARHRGGHGLGLAIAKEIVDQHKGSIYCKSVVNEKTTFYIELPLIPQRNHGK